MTRKELDQRTLAFCDEAKEAKMECGHGDECPACKWNDTAVSLVLDWRALVMKKRRAAA